MITEAEIQSYWGDNLVKIPSELLNKTDLNEKTKKFLSHIGVPVRKEGLLINFKPLDLSFFMYSETRYVVLAQGYGIQICIHEKTGEIHLLYQIGDKHQITFLNSDIQSLISFLQIFEIFYPTVIEIPIGEREEIIQSLEQKFLEIDPKALSNYENR